MYVLLPPSFTVFLILYCVFAWITTVISVCIPKIRCSIRTSVLVSISMIRVLFWMLHSEQYTLTWWSGGTDVITSDVAKFCEWFAAKELFINLYIGRWIFVYAGRESWCTVICPFTEPLLGKTWILIENVLILTR